MQTYRKSDPINLVVQVSYALWPFIYVLCVTNKVRVKCCPPRFFLFFVVVVD